MRSLLKMWTKILKHLAIIAGMFLLMVLFFFYIYLPIITNHGETITVPDIQGMTMSDLDEFLGERKLRFEVSDSSYSSGYEPLTVLSQFPKAGSKVKENRKIYLTVNSFIPPSTLMPNLIDRSLRNAELELSSYELKRGRIILKPSPFENAVLEQRLDGKPIEPGTKIAKGTVIDLVVGDGFGTRKFALPSFVGMPIDEVSVSITGMDLRLGSIINDAGANDELGFVFKQLPEPGEIVKVGQPVDLWIVPTDSLLQLKLENLRDSVSVGEQDEL